MSHEQTCPYAHGARETGAAQEPIVLDPFVRDLQGESAALRAAGPLARIVLPGDVPAYAVTHYEEARRLLQDPRLVKDIDVWSAWQRGEVAQDWPLIGLANPPRSMLTTDGEEHRRLRALTAQALTARRVEQMREGIAALTAERLDRLAAHDPSAPVDLKAEFAYPLPMGVVSRLMGVEDADLPELKALFEKFFSTQTPPEEVPGVMARLAALFTRIVESRRENPGDDLTSALVQASENGDHLTVDEIVNTLQLIVAAGHETTISLIVNAVVCLQSHPEQREMVLSGKVSWEDAIEETLRWAAPTSHVLFRFATEDIAVGDPAAGGAVLPRGEALVVSFGAIGRDAGQYGGTAGEFDVTRSPNRHISFGFGPHVCPGATLSRLEAAVALPALYERFPDLELAVPVSELRNKPVVTQNDLYELPVRLGG